MGWLCLDVSSWGQSEIPMTWFLSLEIPYQFDRFGPAFCHESLRPHLLLYYAEVHVPRSEAYSPFNSINRRYIEVSRRLMSRLLYYVGL